MNWSEGGKAPSLAKRAIAPKGLVMHVLEDKIAAEGKIKASLECPAGQHSQAAAAAEQ